MNAHGWMSQIIRAAAAPKGEVMASLAAHLAACHQANEMLRFKGYGKVGQGIDVAAREVPNNSNGE